MSERGCDPDVVIARLHCAARYIVCPEVEGAAAFQIEARVVPMARQDTVLDGPSLEREAHVRTTIIEGEEAPAVVMTSMGRWPPCTTTRPFAFSASRLPTSTNSLFGASMRNSGMRPSPDVVATSSSLQV